MIDLLRVYGTLCWNLSQITGRKDIPMIHLSYSPKDAAKHSEERDISYLSHLKNQREELKKAVLQAPCYRLDNLAAFVETHGERLAHMLEALISYRKRIRKYRIKSFLMGLTLSVLFGIALMLLSFIAPPLAGLDMMVRGIAGGSAIVLALGFWFFTMRRYLKNRFHKKTMSALDSLTSLNNQTRRDSWEAIRNVVHSQLQYTRGKYSLRDIRRDYATVWKIYQKGSQEIREALRELDSLSPEEEIDFIKERLEILQPGALGNTP
jgi:hypothetical protein